jgi:hypothetical protein
MKKLIPVSLGKSIFIRLVQEPHGSFPSPAEFAANGGKFPVFFRRSCSETEVSEQLYY